MRIDFYLLNSNQPDDLWLVACRLIEKAWHRNHRVFVYCENQEDALRLDELLWTWKDESFIPHHLQGEGPEPPPPVQIGYGPDPRGFNDILINQSASIPAFHTRFKRVIEIVPDQDTAKEISRQHYRIYRASGYTLHTHPIDNPKPGN
jgi:DNA polymerase-3 subunit chi